MSVRLRFTRFLRAKLVEFAVGIVSCAAFFYLNRERFISPETTITPITLLFSGLVMSAIYFLIAGYIVVSVTGYALFRLLARGSHPPVIFAVAMSLIFATHASAVATLVTLISPAFIAFIAVMTVVSFVIHLWIARPLIARPYG